MTTRQTILMATAGMATTTFGAMLTGYSLYKIISLSEEAGERKLSYDEADKIYWAGLGLLGGTSLMFGGASILGSSINSAQSLAYGRGVQDTFKAIDSGIINPKNNEPSCLCCRTEIKPVFEVPTDDISKPELKPEVTVTTF